MTISIQYAPSNLMLQNSIDKSTNSINNSLTRLSSGYRINKAADDSAGLYISSNLNTSIRGYAVANQNAQNALSYLNLASSSLSDMTNILSRMRDLAVTASTETYDTDSRVAMQSEVNKLTEQLLNTRNSTEFNGIKIFDNKPITESTETNASVGSSDTVGTYTVQALSEGGAIARNYTVIKTEDDLKAMANDRNGKYILMNDIELTSDWTPIGSFINNGSYDYSNAFTGEFNGNGYTISNVNIDQSTGTNRATGLFACVSGEHAKVENVNLENVNVKGQYFTSALIGRVANGATVTNCSSSGSVNGTKYCTGGLVGFSTSNVTITNCSSTGTVEGGLYDVGGLIGSSEENCSIINCYTTSSATSKAHSAGGLIGSTSAATIKNCYATGTIKADTGYQGGLVGYTLSTAIDNCYATGNVIGISSGRIGGLVGMATGSTIKNSYSTGDISDTGASVGGFCGRLDGGSLIENCYSTGSVPLETGKASLGRFVGWLVDSDVKTSFYNTDSTFSPGNRRGVGYAQGTCTQDVTGITTAQFSNSNIFEDAGWSEEDWYFTGNDAPKCIWQKPADTTRKFQIGIDESENSVFAISTVLEIKKFKVDLTSREKSLESIDKIDAMLNTVMKKNTEVGAGQNRLESIMNSQTIRKTSLTASKSTILDADVAEESSKYVNSQIRQQCSSALISQLRNSNPSLIMQLINATKF